MTKYTVTVPTHLMGDFERVLSRFATDWELTVSQMNWEHDLPVNPLGGYPPIVEQMVGFCIENERKILAIKYLKDTAGLGLKEAKELLDAFMVYWPHSVYNYGEKTLAAS